MDTDAASLLTEPVAVPEEAVETAEQQVATGKHDRPRVSETASQFSRDAQLCVPDAHRLFVRYTSET